MFAPHLLTERDFFNPVQATAVNQSRHHRYNTRRLAKCLATYFGLDNFANESSTSNPQKKLPIIQLSDCAKNTVLTVCAAARTEEVEPLSVVLALSEVVLCAAVHSDRREPFIKAVLKLTADHQDALAASICRTTIEKSKDNRILGHLVLNDENVDIGGNENAFNSKSTSPESTNSSFSAANGIPLADFKALAAERDSLRRKLAASEFEKNKSVDVSNELRINLEEAADKIRVLQTKQDENEVELVAKSESLNDAKSALRGAHIAAEEVDILRAKAASAEQLESSLKRASKRLEEVADVRKMNEELEAQVTAFRENEERLRKHSEYLESQLSYSNDRTTEFARLSESLTMSLEKTDTEVASLKKQNFELKASVKSANEQLASFLTQSQSQSHSTPVASKNTKSDGGDLSRDKSKSDSSHCLNEQKPDDLIHSSKVKERACDIIFEEIGVRVTWTDILDCMDGVMSALDDMYEIEAGHPSSTSVAKSQHESKSTLQRGKSRPISERSTRSIDTNASYIGSEAESRMSLLPEFAVIDSRQKAKNGHEGDEFDYAANHINVQEIPLVDTTADGSSKKTETLNGSGQNNLSETLYSSAGANESEPADETVNATIASSVSYDGKSSPRDSMKMSHTRPKSPFLAEDITQGSSKQTSHLKISERHMHVHVGDENKSCSLAPVNAIYKSSSLTLSKRSGTSSSSTPSDTTRTLVLQARNELLSLQNTLDLMRTERQSSASMGTLVRQLDVTRRELSEAQEKFLQSNAECNSLRREMDLLMKEVDMHAADKKRREEDEESVLKEKERMIDHLQGNLLKKERELTTARHELKTAIDQIDMLKHSRNLLEDKVRESKVIERAQEAEIAKLNAKLEASQSMVAKLDDVVKRADGLQKEISKERESNLEGIANAVKQEQQIAEEAREEARRMAKNHTNMLEDVRANALAAARGSMKVSQERSPRRSTRFGDFWRRLLHINFSEESSTPHAQSSSPVAESERLSRKASKSRA